MLDFDTYIEKIDIDGNLIWNTGYNSQHYVSLGGIAASPDDGVMVAGYSFWKPADDYVSSATLIRFDAAGTLLWERNLVVGPANRASIYGITSAPEQGYYLTGEVYVDTIFQYDIFLMKIDEDADTVWTRRYGSRNTEWAQALTILPSGEIAAWGHNQPRPPFYNLQGVLVIADDSGNLTSYNPGPKKGSSPAVVVLPNPFSGIAHIVLSPEPVSAVPWSIYAIDGRFIRSGQFTPHTIHELTLADCQPGMYLLHFPAGTYPARLVAVVK